MDIDLSNAEVGHSYQYHGWVIRTLRCSLGRLKQTDSVESNLEWFEVLKEHETAGPIFPTTNAAEAAIQARQVQVSNRRSVTRLEFVAGDDRGWIMREVQVDLDTGEPSTIPLIVAFYGDGSRMPNFRAQNEIEAYALLQKQLSALEPSIAVGSMPSTPSY